MAKMDQIRHIENTSRTSFPVDQTTILPAKKFEEDSLKWLLKSMCRQIG
jgi:hypothetical protein